ncbi:hypothetical protein KC356_g388 [Hortaea werneckii]|nr:hypothetical protein KC356_g388 [Hortaea werneckii]
MANKNKCPSLQKHRAKDPDEPPGFSQSWSRTPKERAARVGYLRRRVFTTVELFEGVLHQLPSVASQLHAIEAVGIQLKSTKVHELKLLESFCDFVSYRYDHNSIVPEFLNVEFEACFLPLDAFGLWTATDDEIKSKCLPYIMQTTVPRDTIWSETYAPLDHSAVCIDAERIRVLMDRVPFIEWAGGRRTIYMYLTLSEEERLRGYSDSEWETLSKIGCARLEYPDDCPPLEDEYTPPEDLLSILDVMLIEDTREMTAWQFQGFHNSSIDQPWREWHDFIWGLEGPLPAGLMSDQVFRAYLVDELKGFVQSDGNALHAIMKKSNRLSGVTYMRLWIHAYANRAWADFMMAQDPAESTKLADSGCSVHFLVPRVDLNGDLLPTWANIASGDNVGFFIHQGRWPEEILHKGRFFNSGKLALMDGAWE